MSTLRQKKAAVLTAKSYASKKPESMRKILTDAGYENHVAQRPYLVTRSNGYKQELAPLLKKYDLTKERYVKTISAALNANKVSNFEGVVVESSVPDHQTRLMANKQAEKLLELDSEPEPVANNPKPNFGDALNGDIDEVELQKVIFKKKGSGEQPS